jgi:hypothetical protein
MESIAHHAHSAPTPNTDDIFRTPLHVKPSSLILNVKKTLPILIGPLEKSSRLSRELLMFTESRKVEKPLGF